MSYLNNLLNLKELVQTAEEMVCSKYGLTHDDVISRSRSHKTSQARFAIWFILRDISKLSSTTIGEIFNVDHSTVLHGIRRAKQLGIPQELGYDACVQAVDKPRTTGGKAVKSLGITNTLTKDIPSNPQVVRKSNSKKKAK